MIISQMRSINSMQIHMSFTMRRQFLPVEKYNRDAVFSINNETNFCFQIVLTYPQVGCLYIQHHLKCLCYLHHSVCKSGSSSPVIWVLEGRWTYFEMEVLLNPWLVLFILCFSFILFSKLLF